MSPRLLQNTGEDCVAGGDDGGKRQRSCPGFFLTGCFWDQWLTQFCGTLFFVSESPYVILL